MLPAFVFGLAAFRLDLGVGAAFHSVCGFAGLRFAITVCWELRCLRIHGLVVIAFYVSVVAGGHTASNAPDLFRPPKLSGAGPG